MTLRAPKRGEAAQLSALAMRSKQSNGYDAAFMAACRAELTITETDLATRRFQVVADGGLWAVAACDPVADGGDISRDINALGRVGEVSLMFVHPDRQGLGYGRLLMDWVLAEAMRMGWQRLVLDADPKAEAFYARMGFETIGRRASGSIPGRTLPHMQLCTGG